MTEVATKLPFISQMEEILDYTRHRISDIKPSNWAEANMKITKGKFQGPLNYNRTPYSREIIDCMSPYHWAQEVVVMGGAQWGKTTSIIEPIIAYYISEHPCDMGYLTGHSDLSDESMAKLDTAIDNAGLRHLIRSNSLRIKNKKTGDTIKMKEFPYGSLVSGSATNHKILRQRSWKVIIADDIEAANQASKKSGSTISLIRERAKSFGRDKKILWVSTPEQTDGIIGGLYREGDQRRWHIGCPRCGVAIVLQWEVPIEGTKEKAGIYWKTDSNGNLERNSVGYVCQECGKFFDDRGKYEMNLNGLWIPTEKNPKDPNIVSFHLPTLYATPGMNDWEYMVRDYLKAVPANGGVVSEDKLKTFFNLSLGEEFESEASAPQASSIQGNMRDYAIGTVPEGLSIRDGNGRIVLLTIGSDMNGTVDDARLDYTVNAYAENGAKYNVVHGSIGTFIPRENGKADKEDRFKWTYRFDRPNSVWPVFDAIVRQWFPSDTGDRHFQINTPGIDVGHLSEYAYPYIDWSIGQYPANPMVGVRGHKEERYLAHGDNLALFNVGKARNDIYYIQVGLIKDMLSAHMQLKWEPGDKSQPPGFMNFPYSAKYVCPIKKKFHDKLGIDYDGDYLYDTTNFFKHYESEHRKLVEGRGGKKEFRWEKKNSASQNHMWDCEVYADSLKEIIVSNLGKILKEKLFAWPDFVQYMLEGN